MQLIRGLYNLPSDWPACVITIGNFDGLHLGHQQLISECVATAKKLSVPAVLMTFDPYPQAFFSKDKEMPCLMGLRDKVLGLQNCGIDYLCVLRFDAELAALSPEAFVQGILVDQLKVKSLVVGDDFRFGAKRAGDFALLEKLGKSQHFGTQQIPTFTYEDKRISSSWLRAALQSGDLDLAQHLLGHPYCLSGRVVSGDKRGRDFGYPTANIYVGQQYLPIAGIFVVTVSGLKGAPLRGVASIGKRPMYPTHWDMLEVFLLDFHQNIYGQHLTVECHHKLRDEIFFALESELIAQIKEDVKNTEAYFSKNKTTPTS